MGFFNNKASGSGSGLDSDLLDSMNAASTNTPSTIIYRDSSGNFSASNITASLTGHSSLDLPLTGGILTGNLTVNKDAAKLITNFTTTDSYDSVEFQEGTSTKSAIKHYGSTFATTPLRDMLEITGKAGVNLAIDGTVKAKVVSAGIIADSSSTEGIFIGAGNEIAFGNNADSDKAGYINYSGYNRGLTRFRDLYIADGKGGNIAYFKGSDKSATFYGTVTASLTGHASLDATATDLTEAKGFSMDLQRFYQENTKLIAGFQTDETWTSVTGIQSVDSTNIKVNSQSLKILENDNTANELYSTLNCSLNLSTFNDGSASTTSDYIYIVCYISDITKIDTSANKGIDIFFFTDAAYRGGYITAGLVTGWNYLKVQKSSLATVSSSPSWANVTKVQIGYYSLANCQNAYISFNSIQLVRKDASLNIPNPFQSNGVVDFNINAGEWFVGLESGVAICRNLNPTLYLSALRGIKAYSTNLIIDSRIKISNITDYGIGGIYKDANNTCYGWLSSTGMLSLTSKISGTSTNYQVAMPFVTGDVIAINMVKNGNTILLTAYKNDDTFYSVTGSYTVTGDHYLTWLTSTAYDNIQALSITTTEHVHHSSVAEIAKSLSIASTTKVLNLNADLLDDMHSATASTPNTIVYRDASGNFSAGTITASLTGHASLDQTVIDATAAQGFSMDLDRYYQENIKLVTDFTETWTSVIGIQSVDAVNIKIGTQSLKILENDTSASQLSSTLACNLDLSKFNDGSVSSTNDYISFVFYISDQTKLKSDGYIQFLFSSLADGSGQRYYTTLSPAGFVTGWNFLKVKKSDFTNDSGNWADIKYIRCRWDSAINAQDAYISYNSIQLVRKDPVGSYPNPFQRNNVVDLNISAGEWFVGLESGDVICRSINATTTSDIVLNKTLASNYICTVIQKIMTTTLYTNFLSHYKDSNNCIITGIYDNLLYVFVYIGGVLSTYTKALTVAQYDVIKIDLIKEGNYFKSVAIKNNSTKVELSYYYNVSGTHNLLLQTDVSRYQNIQALSLTSTEHAHHSNISEIAKEVVNNWKAWTPTVVWGTATPEGSIAQVARYRTMGNTCYFNYSYTATDGNDASSLTISLPISSKDNNSIIALQAQQKVNTTWTNPLSYIDDDSGGVAFRSFSTCTNAAAVEIIISGFYEI